MTDMTPERIYLVRAEDDSGPVWAWSEDPAPGIGMEAADAVEYVRADALSRPSDTEAPRTLDALIALASGDDGLPDDMRADVERLRARLGSPAVPEGFTLSVRETQVPGRIARGIYLNHKDAAAGLGTIVWEDSHPMVFMPLHMLAAAPAEDPGDHFRDATKMVPADFVEKVRAASRTAHPRAREILLAEAIDMLDESAEGDSE